MRTFYEWLIKQDYRKDAVGDLANELLDNVFLPDKKTKNTLLSHYSLNVDSDIYMTTLKIAWIEYKNYRNNLK